VVSNVQCNDNGTPSDPSDDTYTFDVTVNGSNTAGMWTANDAGSTTGSYGVAVSFGPYPISGGNVSFMITDNNDSGCTTTFTATAPATCSSTCSISHVVSNVQCNDNGTPSDPSDDTYTFDVTVNGSNTAGMWTANDAGSTTGSYGVAVSFGPYPISGGNVSFMITDNNDSGCTTTFTANAPATCSSTCSISHVVSNVQCNDNGTPSDPSDDTYTFDVTVNGSNTAGMWTANDAGSTTGSYGVAVSFGPYPISGGNVIFSIVDDNQASCTTNVTAIAPPTCSDMCDITAIATIAVCGDNGTPSDPSDDVFTFDVIVTGSNTASSWTADDVGMTSGSYGSAVAFGPFPISGGDIVLTITDDDDPGCTSIIVILAPETCSNMCSISHMVSNILCNDNGTPTDPSDDTYTFEVTVTGSNTSIGWTASDAASTSGSYDVPELFGPYPISGGNVNFTITDDLQPGCTTNVLAIAPMTCSDNCIISYVVSNILCNDNGTPVDPSDDTYTFRLVVTGTNTGAGWSASDPAGMTGAYGVPVVFGPYLISSGVLNFTITDDNDAGCTAAISVTPPNTCSGTCSIASDVSNITCDNNGTPSDPSDDTYTFDVVVTGGNTALTWTANDAATTTGAYDVVVTFGPYPISGGNVNFIITDADDAGCTTAISVTTPATCSNICEISGVISNIECDDNGTPSNPADDLFTFDILMTGNNTGSTWTADDEAMTSGAYNVVVSFGPFLIADGNVTLLVTDNVSGGCSATLIAAAPLPCSNTCSISHIVSNIVCDNMGTPFDPTDDFYSFDVLVTGSNNGPTWTADDAASTVGVYDMMVSFGPYPIAGGDVGFTITDDNDANCMTNVNVIAPATCSDECNISHVVSNILCSDNGTPSDSTDDTFTFDIMVNGSNISSSWTANDANMTSGAYGVNVSFGPYLINGGVVNFTIHDNLDAACTSNVSILPPPTCSDVCALSYLISSVTCHDNGTPIDPADDTYTFEVVVNGNNTAASWTATDAMSTSGNYGDVIVFGPYLISGGDISFDIIDDNDMTCSTQVIVTAPNSCSGTCSISNAVTNIICFDNGTPSDPSDDIFTFDVTVSGSNTSLAWIADDAINTTGAYNISVVFGPYPIGGGAVNIVITDENDANCFTQLTVTPPATCSAECDITHQILNLLCDDQGTPGDSSDDSFSFDVLVSGSNTSSTWTATDDNLTTGGYNVLIGFGPFLVIDGNVVFDIGDNADLSCTTTVNILTDELNCSDTCSSQTVNSSALTCDPMEVGLARDTLTGAAGCDSIVVTTTSLSPTSNDTVVNFTCDPTGVGMILDTFMNAFGCDSIILTDTRFDLNARDTMSIFLMTCDPSQVGVVRDTFTNSAGCDSIIISNTSLASTSRDTVLTFTCDPSGVGMTWDTLVNEFGCDSIILMDTRFDINARDTMSVYLMTCDPSQVEVLRDTFTNSAGCDSIVISNTSLAPTSRDTVLDFTCDPSGVGMTWDTLVNEFGCDSIILMDTRFDLNARDTMSIFLMTCDPSQVGVFRDTLTNSAGCDSIIISNTSLASTSRDTVLDFTCDPSGVGMTLDTFVNEFGCDSIILTDTRFDLNASDTVSIFLMTCDPSQVGVVRDTFTNSAGCDSIVFRRITLSPSPISDVVILTCDVAAVGIFTDTLTTSMGCDSIIRSDVRFDVDAVETIVINMVSCNPADTGYFETTYVNQFGCDSIVQLTITWQNGPMGPTLIQLSSCDQSLVGVDTAVLISQSGCDSLVLTETVLGTFDLEVDPLFSSISSGDSVLLALSSSNLDWSNAHIIWSPPVYLSCDTCQFVTSTPGESTTYVISVTDAAGCVASVTSVIQVAETSIYVPDAFSPNDDQINDAFTVYVNKPAVIELIQIFNRWGGKVFEREEVNLDQFEGWNGYVLDKPAQEGVFIYQMRVRIGNSESIYLKGEVHLIR
jgi:gliding motility-associated-like protein